MNTCDAIVDRILELCDTRNLSINRLATNSGISSSTLKSIIYGKSQNPGIVTIKILCDGLNISLTEFFATEVFANLEPELD